MFNNWPGAFDALWLESDPHNLGTGGFPSWNHLGNLKTKCQCLCPTPRDLNLTGLKSSLGIRLFNGLPAEDLPPEVLD